MGVDVDQPSADGTEPAAEGDRPEDVVDPLLWREAQYVLGKHSGADGNGVCVCCHSSYPCNARRLAERAEAAARKPWRMGWTARHDLYSTSTVPQWCGLTAPVRREDRPVGGPSVGGPAVEWSVEWSSGGRSKGELTARPAPPSQLEPRTRESGPPRRALLSASRHRRRRPRPYVFNDIT